MRNFRKKTFVASMLLASVFGFTNQEVNANTIKLEQDVNLSEIVNENQKVIKPNFEEVIKNNKTIIQPDQEYFVEMKMNNDLNKDIIIEKDTMMSMQQTLYFNEGSQCATSNIYRNYHENALYYAINVQPRTDFSYLPISEYDKVEYANDNRIASAFTKPYKEDKLLLNDDILRFNIRFKLNNNGMIEQCLKDNFTFDFESELPFKTLNKVENVAVNGKKNKKTTTQVTLNLFKGLDNLTAKDIVINNKKIKVSDVVLKNRNQATYTFNINGEWKQDEKVTLNIKKNGYVFKNEKINLSLNKGAENDSPQTHPNNNQENFDNETTISDETNTTDELKQKNSEQEINEPLSYEEDNQVLLDDEDENTSNKNKKKQPKLSGSIQTFSNDLVLPVFEDETAQINFDENLMVTYYLVIAGITLTGYVLYQRRFEK